MGMLALCDFAGMTENAVKAKIAEDFGIEPAMLDGLNIVVAYMSVGSWGCDSSAFIVYETDGVYYEVNGSHCSCFGFNEKGYSSRDSGTQWEPEEVPDLSVIVQRDDYLLAGGGYDDSREGNSCAIRAHLSALGASA